MKPSPILFLDDHRGIYIPRDFAQCIVRERVTGISEDTYAILENPDHEWYWEAWDEVCRDAVVTDSDGVRYHVYQDGACWLVPHGMDWDDSEGWVWPSDDSSTEVSCD